MEEQLPDNFDFIYEQGGSGTGNDNLSAPLQLDVDPVNKRLLVADPGNNRIVLKDLNGLVFVAKQTEINSNPFNAFGTPYGVCYYNGFWFVSDNSKHVVCRYRAHDLVFKQQFGTYSSSGSTTSTLSSPRGMCHDGQHLYVCDTGNSRIMKLTLKNLDYVGVDSAGLTSPNGICYSFKDKTFFVVDSSDDTIHKLNTDLEEVESFGSNGTGEGEFDTPKDCTVNGDRIYVTDSVNNRIQVIKTSNFTFEAENGSSGTGDGEYNTLTGIVWYDETLIISDTANNRIQICYDYDHLRDITPASTAEFGYKFYRNPVIVADRDTVLFGATDESGSPNRWKEENRRKNSYKSVKE